MMENSTVISTPPTIDNERVLNGVKSSGNQGFLDRNNTDTSITGITRLTNGVPTIRHPLDNREDSVILSDDIELDFTPDHNSTRKSIELLNKSDLVSECSGYAGAIILSDEEEEEDKSIFQAILSPDCQDVKLRKDPSFKPKRRIPIPRGYYNATPEDISPLKTMLSPESLDSKLGKDVICQPKRRIPIPQDFYDQCADDISISSEDEIDESLSPSLESLDEIEDSILEKLGNASPEQIPELTAEEESEECRSWQICTVGGIEKRIDMKVIEPYKRVLSHGGYMNSGSQNAIIVFSACFLPHHGRVDYSYVMDNLFFYVLSTLDQLVTDDYVLVYLHGGAAKDCMPKFSWLKRCYQMIDHRLRKNLRHLYLTHPTFWLKTIVAMTRPFVSSKFSKKIIFVNSLSQLFDIVPLEQASIPDRVHHYDRIKQSIESKRK